MLSFFFRRSQKKAARDLKHGDRIKYKEEQAEVLSVSYATDHFVAAPGWKMAAALYILLSNGITIFTHPNARITTYNRP